MIKSEEISIILQGPTDKTETPKCIRSIRKFLPNAEIILSTWENEDAENLDYDFLVKTKPIEAVLIKSCKSIKIYNNINRQLLSTQSGLKKSTRKYAMKLRTDLILSGNEFLEYFDKFQKRSPEYNLFERKILTSALFTRVNLKAGKHTDKVNLPFHVSDWWLFGLRKDLNTYFLDTPLVEEPFFTKYFGLEENKNRKTPYGMSEFRFAPEQYYGYECFRRNFDGIYMKDAADVNDDLVEKSRKCIVNNFIVLEFKQSGIYLNKYMYSKNEKFSGDQYADLYNFYTYECEYKKYCDSDYRITTQDKIFQNEKECYDILRIYKHIAKLFEPSTPLINKIEQILVSIPIACISYFIKSLTGKYPPEK